MLPTLIGGGIALAVALLFFGVLLAKVHAIPLWIVALFGIGLMLASLIEAVRSGEEQLGGGSDTELPEGQQDRGGMS